MGTYYQALTNCAPGYFTGRLDGDGNMTSEAYLNGIATVKEGDVYYAKNADGTRGNVIFIDFKQPTRSNPMMSLEDMIESWVYANDGSGDKFHPFNFTKALTYVLDKDGYVTYDDAGNAITKMIDWTGEDYTQTCL